MNNGASQSYITPFQKNNLERTLPEYYDKESSKLIKFILLERHNRFRIQYHARENFEFFKGHYFNNEKIVDFCLQNLNIFEAGMKVTGVCLQGDTLWDYLELSPIGMNLIALLDGENNECVDYCTWLKYVMNSSDTLSPMNILLTFRILMRFLISETYGISILQYKTSTSTADLEVKIHEMTEINRHLESSLMRIASDIRLLNMEGKRDFKRRRLILDGMRDFIYLVKKKLWSKSLFFSKTKFTGLYIDKAEPNPLLSAPLCIAMLDAALFGECGDVPLELSPPDPRVTIHHLKLIRNYNIDLDSQRKAISYFHPKLRFFEPIPEVHHYGIPSEFYSKMQSFLRLYEETNSILDRLNLDALYAERLKVKKQLDFYCFRCATSYAAKISKILKGPANCFYDINKVALERSYLTLIRLVQLTSDSIAFVNTFVPYVAQLIRMNRVESATPDICSFTSHISKFKVKSIFPHIIWTH